MSTEQRGADALIQCLLHQGVDTIYTLSGNHIMPIFDAALGSGIELIHVRHEASAVHMADAAARLSGRIGVAMVTGGPGHANAVSALYTAWQSESSVLLISGHAPTHQMGKGAFQEMDQTTVAAPCAKASVLIRSRETLEEELNKAIALATTGRRGPVSVSVAQDALEALGPALPQFKPIAASFLAVEPTRFEPLIAMIAQSDRPIALTGPQMLQPMFRGQLNTLQTQCCLPAIGMESPRGMNDPTLGRFATIAPEADLVVLLGKQLDFTLKFADTSAFSSDAVFAVVDPDAAAIGRAKSILGPRLRFSLQYNIPEAIQILAEHCAPNTTKHGDWTTKVQAAVSARPKPHPAPSDGLMHPADALAPFVELAQQRNMILVCDGGEFGQWAQASLRLPVRLINGPAGAIGAAIPMAIAAAHAQPDALVVAFMGDGAFGFHASEFDTAVRYGKRFIAVVGNDACWNAEYQIQKRSFGQERLIGCELLPIEYQRVAQAYGAHGASCQTPEQVQTALTNALGSDRAFCINMFISRSSAPSF